MSKTFLAIFLLIFCHLHFPISAQYFDCDEELFPRQDRQTRLYGYVNFIGEQRVPPTFIRAFPFEGKYAVVQQGKKYGVIDCSGNFAVPAVYDGILSFVNGKGWAKVGDKWGLIDQRGQVLIPPTYEQAIDVNPRGIYTWVNKSEKWGLISKENGRFIIPLDYDTYTNLSDSACITRKGAYFHVIYYGDGRVIYPNLKTVKKLSAELYLIQKTDGKYGVISSLAYTLIRPEYDSLYLQQGLFYVMKNGLWGLKNLRGADLTAIDYQYISPFSNGLAAVKKNEKYTWLTVSGKETEPPIFQFAGNADGGVAIVQQNKKYGLYVPFKRKFILEPQFDKAYRNAGYNLIFLANNDRGELYDESGRMLTTCQADSVCLHDLKHCLRFSSNKKWGLLDGVSAKMIVAPTYDSLAPSNMGMLWAKAGSQFGIIHESGKIVLNPEYDRIERYFLERKPYYAAKKILWALLDSLGRNITPHHYNMIAPASEKIIVVAKNNKYGVIDAKGAEIIPLQYDFLSNVKDNPEAPIEPLIFLKGKKSGLLSTNGNEIFSRPNINLKYLGNGMYGFLESGKWGLLHQSGKIITEPTWDAIEKFYEKTAPARSNDLWGLINQQGKWTVAPKYTEMLPRQGNLIFVKEQGKWGAINALGKTIIKPTFSGYQLTADGKIKLTD